MEFLGHGECAESAILIGGVNLTLRDETSSYFMPQRCILLPSANDRILGPS